MVAQARPAGFLAFLFLYRYACLIFLVDASNSRPRFMVPLKWSCDSQERAMTAQGIRISSSSSSLTTPAVTTIVVIAMLGESKRSSFGLFFSFG